jgi:hypothetical protein
MGFIELISSLIILDYPCYPLITLAALTKGDTK